MKTKAIKIYKQGNVEELKVEETFLRNIGEDDIIRDEDRYGRK